MTVETFKIEVLPLKNKLYRLSKRLLKNSDDAEDIVQEVFMRLWSRRERLSEYKSIEAFAMVITKNLSLDKLKLKKNKADELSDKFEQMTEHTPYNKVEMTDSFNKIQDIISMLPEQQRMIIHLRDIEGYEFEEISEIVQMSINTVRVNLSRARKKVRETMVKTYSYEFGKN